MEEYITLPIIISLQQYQQYEQLKYQKQQQQIIPQSACQKAIENASSCLATYIHYLHHFEQNSYSLPSTIMSTKIQMKCIIALTMTLTSILESSSSSSSSTNTASTSTM
jgi:hypothetical protein